MLTFGAWWPRSTRQEALSPSSVRDQVVGAPILHDRRVEGRLVHLVLGEQAPVLRQRRVDRLHRIEIALEAPREMRLAGKVRPVADPDGQRLGADRLADLDAFDVVLDRLARATPGIRVAQRAELVGLRLPGRVRRRCWSSWRRSRGRARRHGPCRRRGSSTLSHGICSDTLGVARVSCWITAQSSSLSKMLRGSPGPGKRAKRVPPVPTPQDGTATKNSATASVTASMSIPFARELVAQGLVIGPQRRRSARRSRRR